MVYINKLNHGRVEIIENGNVAKTYPPVFNVRTKGDDVYITSARPNFFAYSKHFNFADIEINGIIYDSAIDAANALQKFITPALDKDKGSYILSFEPGRFYDTDKVIVHDGAIWRAKKDFKAGAEFNPDDWESIGVSVIDLDKKLDREKHTDDYTSRFFHNNGSEGGYWVKADNAEIGALTRYDASPVKRLVHVISSLNGLGTRLMHTLSKIYYTKGKGSEGYTDADEIATTGNVDSLSSAVYSELNMKADKIIIPHIEWNPDEINIPEGRTLHFDTTTTPVISGTGIPMLAYFTLINGDADRMFGFFSNDAGQTTLAGLFHINDEMTAFVPDTLLYDGAQWLNDGNYELKYSITGHLDEITGAGTTLSGFDLQNSISIPDMPPMNLIDVENQVLLKQNKLKTGDNIEININDPLNPIIRTKTVTPDVNLADGQVADAKKTAAMIAEAVRNTHNRGKVISAYSPAKVWAVSEPSVNITNPGTNYQTGDSLQYGLKYIDILFVVKEVDSNGAVIDYTISSLGANDTDFSTTNPTLLTMHGGHGTGFTIESACEKVDGTTLANIANPQPNDEIRVVLDETHSLQSWDWIFADYNGDGIYNWVSLAPAGNTRDFYTEPVKSGEIDSKAVTDTKIADCITESDITESNSKFTANTTYTFPNFRNAIIAKINALFGNKVDRTNEADKVYGTDDTGAQTTFDKDAFGKVDTVNGIEPDTNKNVQTDYIYETEAEFESAEATIPIGATVIKLYEYANNEKNGSYSLEEIKTAEKWHDGKSIYKRSFVETFDQTGYYPLKALDANGITKTIVRYEIEFTHNSGWSVNSKIYYNSSVLSDIAYLLQVTSNNRNLNVRANIPMENYINGTYTITAWYTKTTD